MLKADPRRQIIRYIVKLLKIAIIVCHDFFIKLFLLTPTFYLINKAFYYTKYPLLCVIYLFLNTNLFTYFNNKICFLQKS